MTTNIKSKLRAALLTGAVGFLPAVALAEDVPDHAEAEARSMTDTPPSTMRTTPGIPDHAEAEARTLGDTPASSDRTGESVPDHQSAEEGSTGSD